MTLPPISKAIDIVYRKKSDTTRNSDDLCGARRSITVPSVVPWNNSISTLNDDNTVIKLDQVLYLRVLLLLDCATVIIREV